MKGGYLSGLLQIFLFCSELKKETMKVVITGASRGIGKEIARVFAADGYDLFLCSRKNEVLQETIRELRAEFASIQIQGKAFDLGNKEQALAFGEWVNATAGAADILVNNAGTFTPGNISEEPDGALEQMLNVNLFSAYHVTRAVLPAMMKRKSGHIFTICSIAALDAYPNGGAYSISKFALLGFTKNLRKELMPHNIKVTAIVPGAVYTDSWKGFVEPERIMAATDIASVIYNASHLSPQANIDQIILRPQAGDL
jgi:short-subunit dehydrogenase